VRRRHMAGTTSKGICYFCKGEFSKAGMTQHLKSCKQRAAVIAESESDTKSFRSEKTGLFHIMIHGLWLPMYWLHIEMPASARLADLDTFLRDIWLECCGHLSAFRIGNGSYSSDVEETDDAALDRLDEMLAQAEAAYADPTRPPLTASVDDLRFFQQVGELPSFTFRGNKVRSMAPELGKVLQVGQKFTHEYDFGSTTELDLKVAAEREGRVKKGKQLVEVLARNLPPIEPCADCGKPAKYLSVVNDHAWCATCAEEHEGDYEFGTSIRVVNSPRMGVCGYVGKDEWL
jgi:hypothetical protein